MTGGLTVALGAGGALAHALVNRSRLRAAVLRLRKERA
jgi:uncharacterized cupin superfamily protein